MLIYIYIYWIGLRINNIFVRYNLKSYSKLIQLGLNNVTTVTFN